MDAKIARADLFISQTRGGELLLTSRQMAPSGCSFLRAVAKNEICAGWRGLSAPTVPIGQKRSVPFGSCHSGGR
jgi:hypothetical protein